MWTKPRVIIDGGHKTYNVEIFWALLVSFTSRKNLLSRLWWTDRDVRFLLFSLELMANDIFMAWLFKEQHVVNSHLLLLSSNPSDVTDSMTFKIESFCYFLILFLCFVFFLSTTKQFRFYFMFFSLNFWRDKELRKLSIFCHKILFSLRKLFFVFFFLLSCHDLCDSFLKKMFLLARLLFIWKLGKEIYARIFPDENWLEIIRQAFFICVKLEANPFALIHFDT